MPDYNVVGGQEPGAVPVSPVGPGDWNPPSEQGAVSSYGQAAYIADGPQSQAVAFENAAMMAHDPTSPFYAGSTGPPPGAIAAMRADADRTAACVLLLQ